jgi:acyl-CoA synthetase (AMP-forming)/AMP-acid ligase II
VRTMADLLARNSAWFPRVEAYVDGSRRATFRDYFGRVQRLADALRRLGLRRQDRIGILSTNNLEYAEIYGVAEYASYLLALYNFRLAAPEIEWVLTDSVPEVVFFEAQFAPVIDGLRAKFPGIRRYVCIGGPKPAWADDYESLLASGSEGGAPFRTEPEDYIYLYYTSGTTGRPKGVPHSQQAALITAQSQGDECGPDTRVLQVTPMFHVGGKGFPLAMAWMAGTTVLERQFDPLRFLQLVQAERITFTFMVAPMIQAVLDHPRFAEFDLSSLRMVMSASAPIPVPLLKRAIDKFGPVFYLSYGSTEASGIARMWPHELRPDGSPEDVARLGSVGHFNPFVDAVLLDDANQPVPPGQVGEVCVKPRIFREYWNNSVATIEALRGGWLHTGDLGRLDDEGYLYLVDRKKDMIISGGENIYSREVEEALHRHPAVQEAAVIGVPDPKWVETVKAVVVLRAGQTATTAELTDFCRTQIAKYKCPKSIELVTVLPRLGSGKIDKVALRTQYRGGT